MQWSPYGQQQSTSGTALPRRSTANRHRSPGRQVSGQWPSPPRASGTESQRKIEIDFVKDRDILRKSIPNCAPSPVTQVRGWSSSPMRGSCDYLLSFSSRSPSPSRLVAPPVIVTAPPLPEALHSYHAPFFISSRNASRSPSPSQRNVHVKRSPSPPPVVQRNISSPVLSLERSRSCPRFESAPANWITIPVPLQETSIQNHGTSGTCQHLVQAASVQNHGALNQSVVQATAVQNQDTSDACQHLALSTWSAAFLSYTKGENVHTLKRVDVERPSQARVASPLHLGENAFSRCNQRPIQAIAASETFGLSFPSGGAAMGTDEWSPRDTMWKRHFCHLQSSVKQKRPLFGSVQSLKEHWQPEQEEEEEANQGSSDNGSKKDTQQWEASVQVPEVVSAEEECTELKCRLADVERQRISLVQANHTLQAANKQLQRKQAARERARERATTQTIALLAGSRQKKLPLSNNIQNAIGTRFNAKHQQLQPSLSRSAHDRGRGSPLYFWS